MVKRYTRKLAKRGGATYREQQKSLLCGKHAMNHVLQEEKFVWEPKVKTLYIPALPVGETAAMHIKKSETKVNMVVACNEYNENTLKNRESEQYSQALDNLYTRLFVDVEIETKDPKIPEPGSYRTGKYGTKTDDEIKKEILADRKTSFAKVKANQDKDRAKYKEAITFAKDGKVTSINRDKLNEIYKKEWLADQRDEINRYDSACDASGNFRYELLRNWANILGYKGFSTSFYDVTPDIPGEGALPKKEGVAIYNNDRATYLTEMLKILPSQMAKPEFLGIVLGTARKVSGTDIGHFTAVVMYEEDCEPKRRVESDQNKKLYSFIDSMEQTGKDGVCTLSKGAKACYTQTELLAKIKKLEPASMVFLYGYDADDKGPLNPYKSVAYQRMKAASSAPAPTTEESNRDAESNNEDVYGILKNANEREAEEARKRREELEEERFWRELNWQSNFHPSPNNYASKEEWKKAIIEEARQQKSKDPANIAAVRERRRQIHESISSIPFEEYEKSKLSKKDDDSDSNSDSNSESDDNSDKDSNEDPNVKTAMVASLSSAEEDEKARTTKEEANLKAATEESLAATSEIPEQVYEKEMARIKSLTVPAKIKQILEEHAKAEKLVAINKRLYNIALNPPKGYGVKTSATVMKENSPETVQKRLDKWTAKLKEAKEALAAEEAKL